MKKVKSVVDNTLSDAGWQVALAPRRRRGSRWRRRRRRRRR